jgi:hypothetical protein
MVVTQVATLLFSYYILVDRATDSIARFKVGRFILYRPPPLLYYNFSRSYKNILYHSSRSLAAWIESLPLEPLSRRLD